MLMHSYCAKKTIVRIFSAVCELFGLIINPSNTDVFLQLVRNNGLPEHALSSTKHNYRTVYTAFPRPVNDTHSSMCQCTTRSEKKSAACSQGDERVKQTPQREMRTRTLCLKYLDLFKALLGHSLWVGRWHLGQLLPCRTKNSTLHFYQRFAHLNITMCSWQFEQKLLEGQSVPRQRRIRTNFYTLNCNSWYRPAIGTH